MYHPLTPKTIEKISAAQLPAAHTFEMKLEAKCMAYKNADNDVAYYSLKHIDPEARQCAAQAREHFLADVRPLIGALCADVTDQQWADWLAGK